LFVVAGAGGVDEIDRRLRQAIGGDPWQIA
jgi:hypothetical protein